MKEENLSFETFFIVFQYIITRLRNNARLKYYTNDYDAEDELEAHFMLFLNDISVTKEVVLEVLDCFSNGNGHSGIQRIISYRAIDDELYLSIQGSAKVALIQNIYNNLREIKHNTKSQGAFMQFVECSKNYNDNEYIFSSLVTDTSVQYELRFTDRASQADKQKAQVINIAQQIWSGKTEQVNLKNNEDKYNVPSQQVVQEVIRNGDNNNYEQKLTVSNDDTKNKSSVNNELAIKTTKILEDEVILELICTPQHVAMLRTKEETINLRASRPNSIQRRLLRFLIDNPNTTFTRQQLIDRKTLLIESESWTGKENKKFASFANDIKITGILRKLLFGVDTAEHDKKDTVAKIRLTNPITRSYIEQSGYTIEQVNQEIEKIKTS